MPPQHLVFWFPIDHVPCQEKPTVNYHLVISIEDQLASIDQAGFGPLHTMKETILALT